MYRNVYHVGARFSVVMTRLEKVVSQKPVVWHLRKCVATLPTTQFRCQNRPPPLGERGLMKSPLTQTNFLQKGRLKTGRQYSLVMCHGLTGITNHWLPFGEPLATLQTGFHHLGSNIYEDSINHGTKRTYIEGKVNRRLHRGIKYITFCNLFSCRRA